LFTLCGPQIAILLSQPKHIVKKKLNTAKINEHTIHEHASMLIGFHYRIDCIFWNC